MEPRSTRGDTVAAMQLGDTLPSLDLLTPDGRTVRLPDVIDRTTVVALPRYYG